MLNKISTVEAKNIQKEISERLESLNYVVKTSDSENNFGNSYYVYAFDSEDDFNSATFFAKIRISDHGVSNVDRIFNEIHFFGQSIDSVIDEVNFKLRTSEYFDKKEIQVTEKAFNVQANDLRENDEVTNSFISKKGKQIFEVTRTYVNTKLAYFKKGSDKPYIILN